MFDYQNLDFDPNDNGADSNQYGEPLDLDDDGYTDAYAYDTNDDGYADVIAFEADTNNDGTTDRTVQSIDTNGDGVFDAMVLSNDYNQDGNPDDYRMYGSSNGDENMDIFVHGTDENHDGEIDTFHGYADLTGNHQPDVEWEDYVSGTHDMAADVVFNTEHEYAGDSTFDGDDGHSVFEAIEISDIHGYGDIYDRSDDMVDPPDYMGEHHDYMDEHHDYTGDHHDYTDDILDLHHLDGNIEYINSTFADELGNFDPSQADPDAVSGNPEEAMNVWEFQGDTNRCALYSQKFIIEQLSGQDIDIEDVADVATSHGWFSEDEGTPLLNMAKILDHYGIDNEMSFNNSVDDLKDCLDAGRKIIVSIDADEIWYGEQDNLFTPVDGANHAVEVIGIDSSDPDQPMVILNDSGNPNGCGEAVPLDTFRASWEDGDYQMIVCG